MNFCSNCGSAHLEFRIPEDDHFPRYCCTNCKTTHYENPNMVVGCVVVKEGKIMLARRGIEPRKGFWNLPCGFLENDETIEEGAIREVYEETGATVELQHLHTVYNLPHARQVYLIFTARMLGDHYHLTAESTEIAFFAPAEIPWQEIAFSSNTFAIEKYLENESQEPRLYIGTFRKNH